MTLYTIIYLTILSTERKVAKAFDFYDIIGKLYLGYFNINPISRYFLIFYAI